MCSPASAPVWPRVAPVVVEMSVRFGGPIGAFEEGASAGQVDARTGVVENVLVHLAATDGRRADLGAPVAGIVVGHARRGRRDRDARAPRRVERSVSVLALIGALVLASEYLSCVGDGPSVPPADLRPRVDPGLPRPRLLRGQVPPVVARVAGVPLAAPASWAIWQGTVADRYPSKRTISTVAFESAGQTLRRLADGETCAFQTPHGWPTTMFVSGCDGSDLVRPGGPTAAQLDELASEADRVFAILEARAPRSSPLRKTPSSSRVPPSRGTFYERP